MDVKVQWVAAEKFPKYAACYGAGQSIIIPISIQKSSCIGAEGHIQQASCLWSYVYGVGGSSVLA